MASVWHNTITRLMGSIAFLCVLNTNKYKRYELSKHDSGSIGRLKCTYFFSFWAFEHILYKFLKRSRIHSWVISIYYMIYIELTTLSFNSVKCNFHWQWGNVWYCYRTSFDDSALINCLNNAQFPLTLMGVLAPGSAHARPSARPPIGMSGNFPAKWQDNRPGRRQSLYEWWRQKPIKP